MRSALVASTLAALLFAATAQAAPDPAVAAAQTRAFLDSLQYRTGVVAIPEAKASLQVQSGFRYLAQADARRVLEDFWSNPPDESVLGLLVPDNAGLDSEHSWAVVVSYSDDGYIADEDAAKLDFDEILAGMKQDTADENAERKHAGYGTVELLGWAQPPRYDAAAKRIHWAKQLRFEGESQDTVNYDIRVLGRGGYLSLNAVASASDLALVRDGMARVLPMAQFDAGQRYADYRPGSDKLAAYGLAALVGGGAAAKAGLFAKIGAFLLAAKKLVALVLVGLVALGARLFRGRKDGGPGV